VYSQAAGFCLVSLTSISFRFLTNVLVFFLFCRQGHTSEITCLSFATDAFIVSGSSSGNVLIHGLQQGSLAGKIALVDKVNSPVRLDLNILSITFCIDYIYVYRAFGVCLCVDPSRPNL
jgi:WD40 repeat protein